MNFPIYLDNNATTPCDPRVVDAMLPFFTNQFGNAASRNHPFGWAAEEAVDYAREQIAQLSGADPKEIIFTSGATEGDNLGIKGVYEMYASKGNHIITSTTEHKAVLDTCKHLEKLGVEVTYLEVQPDGLIDLKQLEADYEGIVIPRPKHWGGFLVTPIEVEFWQGRPNRLHDRIRFIAQEDYSWKIDRLSP